MLEALYRESVENYLGVALIRSGDSVTIETRGFGRKKMPEQAGWNREQRYLVPYGAKTHCKGLFYFILNLTSSRKGEIQ